jgi:lipopolysaccharide/colanic/teichoic acid biosynthesis glycosyltransferase
MPDTGELRLGKRLLDLFLTTLLLMLLLPVAAVAAAMVRAILGRRILFRQTRAGMNAEPFTLYKLRTMRLPEAVDSRDRDEVRLVPFGSFLRSASLDELPELFNVLKGDMSLVGPRPLPVEYVGRYTPEQARRHEVKPGITGWAQVNGRNALTWEERFELDVWYVDNRSLWLDLRILARTLGTVLSRRGISHPGHATMEKFGGSA